jgi:hypothetical protein
MDKFRDRKLPLPSNARQLGGRTKAGFGEYYREIMASQRTLVRDRNGNWIARWNENGKPDHYLHAEVYCSLAAQTCLDNRIFLPW